MAKRGTRLREFEKNNRVLDISSKQEARREKNRANREKKKSVEANKTDDKENKRDWKKIAIRGAIFIFILMILGTARNIYILKEKEEELLNENIRLMEIKAQLLEESEGVRSASYIEKVARRDLQLAKSDDLIFYFTEKEEESKG